MISKVREFEEIFLQQPEMFKDIFITFYYVSHPLFPF